MSHLRTNSSSSTPSRSNIVTGKRVRQFKRAVVNETSSESSSEPKVWKRRRVRINAQLDSSASSEISVEEETSQSENEKFSDTDNDSVAALSIEEDLNYSIKRYCNYMCTSEHSTHDHAIEDIHLTDDTSARTPRSYSSISEEGKRAAAKFHYSYDSISRITYVWMYMYYWPSARSRWLDIGRVLFLRLYDEVEVHEDAKRERGQYTAMLTELAWSIKDLLCGIKSTEKIDLRTCLFTSTEKEASYMQNWLRVSIFSFSSSIPTGKSQKIFLLWRKIFCERKRSCTRLDLYHVISFIQWEPAEIIRWAININIYACRYLSIYPVYKLCSHLTYSSCWIYKPANILSAAVFPK